jgi:hypothetical protein
MAQRKNNRSAIKRHAVAMMPVRVFFVATVSRTRDFGILVYRTKEAAP